MKLAVWKYRSAIPGIHNAYRNNLGKPLREIAGIAAINTHVPIVAVCYFLEELLGKNEELEATKKDLIKFYQYDEIEVVKHAEA